jgi:hypothetical protein
MAVKVSDSGNRQVVKRAWGSGLAGLLRAEAKRGRSKDRPLYKEIHAD